MKQSVFITLDADWACEEILAYALDLIEQSDISASFYVTNESRVLKRMRGNKNIEIGIHPDFSKLLDGRISGNARDILERCMRIVPDATSVRSHDHVRSTSILNLFKNAGLSHDLNMLIPQTSGISLYPYQHWNGMTIVPYFWADDVHCVYVSNGYNVDWSVSRYLDGDGLKVFSFHPIHLYLNTDTWKRYKAAKPYSNDLKAMQKYRNTSTDKGSACFFVELLKEVRRRNMKTKLIREINPVPLP